jgi:hypothetical protein
MSPECPICAQTLHPGASTCDGCGFPVPLWSEVAKALEEPMSPAAPSPARASISSRRLVAIAPKGRDPTGDACTAAARELLGHLAILGQLGGVAQGFAGEMRQAALVQAEGRAGEALELLKAAEAQADREIAELFARRSQELEARAATLKQQGVVTEIESSLTQLHDAIAETRREEAVRLVVAADRSLASLEQDLRGLKGLLDQIRLLREGANEAGRPMPEVDEDLAQVEAFLARPKVDAEVLDSAAQVAARALMLLHEALPAILEADLDKHGSALSTYPTEHAGSRKAKSIHADIARQLRRGRLPEATARLRELRVALRLLESETPPAPELPPAGASPGPAAMNEDALPRLLAKARSLATRVRALTPESEIAFEAAAEIRRATELLRARKLEEADSALTRLMKTLDSELTPEP